jgi:hypothetical protein
VKYFCLDQKGCLIFEHGAPKLYKCEWFRSADPPPITEPQIEMLEPEVHPRLSDPYERDDIPGGDETDFATFFGGTVDNDFNAYEGWNPYRM